MTIKPTNRFLLIGRCEDPRTQGKIIAGITAALAFGVVEATDPDRTTSSPSVGEIVFYPGGAALPVVADRNIGKHLVNEASIVAIVSDVNVKARDLDISTLVSQPDIVVPRNALVN